MVMLGCLPPSYLSVVVTALLDPVALECHMPGYYFAHQRLPLDVDFAKRLLVVCVFCST